MGRMGGLKIPFKGLLGSRVESLGGEAASLKRGRGEEKRTKTGSGHHTTRV